MDEQQPDDGDDRDDLAIADFELLAVKPRFDGWTAGASMTSSSTWPGRGASPKRRRRSG